MATAPRDPDLGREGLSDDAAARLVDSLNDLLKAAGLTDSALTTWWNQVGHEALGGRTASHAWSMRRYNDVVRLVTAEVSAIEAGEEQIKRRLLEIEQADTAGRLWEVIKDTPSVEDQLRPHLEERTST